MTPDVDALKAAEKEQFVFEAEKEQLVVPRSSSCRRRKHRHGRRGSAPWGFGLALIILGGLLLFSNLTGWSLVNWWALFILLPAFGSLNKAVSIRRATGHFPKPAREALGWGIILLLVATLFLFGLNWSVFWPILLVGVGVAAILNNVLR